MKGRRGREEGGEGRGMKKGKEVGWRKGRSEEDSPIASLAFLSYLYNDL